jgi:hypothetical protein
MLSMTAWSVAAHSVDDSVLSYSMASMRPHIRVQVTSLSLGVVHMVSGAACIHASLQHMALSLYSMHAQLECAGVAAEVVLH